MSHRLKKRQEKIQEKRKQTPWREFIRDIASRMPVVFHKSGGILSRYPATGREGNVIETENFSYDEVCAVEEDEVDEKDIFGTLQFLFLQQPKMSIQQRFENENSTYAEVYGGRNCYLSFGVGQGCENVLYSACSHSSVRNILNSFSIIGTCDNIYFCKIVTSSYNVFYSKNIHGSSNIWWGVNLLGCSECLLCDNLTNKKYCIKNIEYEKDVYEQKKHELLKEKHLFHSRMLALDAFLIDNKVSENVQGYGVVNSKNIEQGWYVKNVTHGRNLYLVGGDYADTHIYDCFDAGNQVDEHLYATYYVGETSSHVYCMAGGANLSYVFYSINLDTCSYCFGCNGLKNKSYCIFNKQYTKEERYKKVDEIFANMEEQGVLGDFFPGSMNPFYFNDTAAYLIDPSFTKEEVEAKGFLRRDDPIKVDIPEGVQTVNADELHRYEGRTVGTEYFTSELVGTQHFASIPEEAIRKINPEILKKVIVDEEGNAWRVIPLEVEFLQKYGLPLPRKHWLERLKSHFRVCE